ncbi:MAG: phosphate signaling complex protein PhoU [Gemmatimonadetes bacterium]|nr:phosphate signaling complex protein PhoU [Gemmatimonadota bacterium]
MSHKHFDERLEDLRQALHRMSHDIEELVQRALALVGKAGIEAEAEAIREADRAVDAAEVEIEENAIELLALHQPMAGDLRVLVTVLKINNDLERIGDHAVNIAKAASRLGKLKKKVPIPPELSEMGRMAGDMLNDALDAFVHENAQEADDVRARDDRVDQLQDSLFRVMLTHMTEHNISGCLQVILIGRNLERIADLATNIGEDVIYMVEGKTVRHQSGPMEEAVG